MPICMAGWSYGSFPSDGVRFKESVKGGCTTSVPQQVCSVWLESDDGTEDGWAEISPSWCCAMQPRLICIYMSELSFLVSSICWLATSDHLFSREFLFVSCGFGVRFEYLKTSLTASLRTMSGPFAAICSASA